MNFLAHLHCSPNHKLVRVFNFTGDGFRGSGWKEQATPEKVIGVELHRFIDSFTDEHPTSKKAKTVLREAAGKTAPIALDLFGDYFLHKHWNEMKELQPFTKELTVEAFIQTCFIQIHEMNHLLEGKASRMWPFMRRENWLMDYQELSGIKRAALGMSRRHPAIKPLGTFFTQLTEEDESYAAAEQWFLSFYPELIAACAKFVEDHPRFKTISWL
jgi:acyl carrier protein phosphodiesterase